MGDFLEKMAAASRDRASMLRIAESDPRLTRPVAALTLGAFDLIAELKDRSPAEGLLREGGPSRSARAAAYAKAGAAAISVLTEPFRFDGEIAHLEEVATAVEDLNVPVMRKDFLVSTRQILEARASGASGVLLIAAMLDDRELSDMLSCAREHSLFVLLESFDETDLDRSARLLEQAPCADDAADGRLLFGVNTRNLRSLQVDERRLERFAALLPPDVRVVAESGLRSADDAARAAQLGYRLALVGTALMRATDPGALVGEMLTAGRGVA